MPRRCSSSSRCPANGVSARRGMAVASGSTDSSRNAVTSPLFPLRVKRIEPCCAYRVGDERMSRLSENDLAGRSCLFEPLTDRHSVAADESVPRCRIAGHDLAAVDANAQLEARGVGLAVELRDAVTDSDSGPHRPKCIVLVHERHPEDGHDLVPDEFLDGASMLLDDRSGTVEELRHHEPQCLGVELLGELRVGDEVAEKYSHQLPALGRPAEKAAHVTNVTPARKPGKVPKLGPPVAWSAQSWRLPAGWLRASAGWRCNTPIPAAARPGGSARPSRDPPPAEKDDHPRCRRPLGWSTGRDAGGRTGQDPGRARARATRAAGHRPGLRDEVPARKTAFAKLVAMTAGAVVARPRKGSKGLRVCSRQQELVCPRHVTISCPA